MCLTTRKGESSLRVIWSFRVKSKSRSSTFSSPSLGTPPPWFLCTFQRTSGYQWDSGSDLELCGSKNLLSPVLWWTIVTLRFCTRNFVTWNNESYPSLELEKFNRKLFYENMNSGTNWTKRQLPERSFLEPNMRDSQKKFYISITVTKILDNLDTRVLFENVENC